ncbi:MAG: methyltransferase [Euryarchaeota archaeon]|nr:methyltransferase [Euryarchaeota archaeon]
MKRIDKSVPLALTDDAKTIYLKDDVIDVLPDVYEPADDSYLLLEAACKEVRPTDTVLEVGTGCGLIAKVLAKRARCVIATDINPHAVVNARLNGVDAVEADLFGDLNDKFDLIIFNPPYLPAGSDTANDWYAKAVDGGAMGYEVILTFISRVCSHLTPHGRALVLISSLTGYRTVVENMRCEFELVKTVAEQKCFFETLYVIIGQLQE